MPLSMPERMTKLEEKVDTVAIAVKDIAAKLDNLDVRYITRREYEAITNSSKGTSGVRQMVISMAVSVAVLLIAIYKL